ncbi:MAG: hypothetical protein IBX57_00360 [Gammaproteobacteria bacterium]|nr:hypothetical protein [Gammaproteobacteria bacterium]
MNPTAAHTVNREDSLWYTPNGFYIKDPKKFEDGVIKEYLRQASESERFRNSWEFKKFAIAYVKEILTVDSMGLITTWVRSNARADTPLTGKRLDFLIDTMSFVNTGKRKISIINWNDLIPNLYDYDVNIQKSKSLYGDVKHLEEITPRCSVSEFITRWCSHPDGFNDMVQFIRITTPYDEPKPEKRSSSTGLNIKLV